VLERVEHEQKSSVVQLCNESFEGLVLGLTEAKSPSDGRDDEVWVGDRVLSLGGDERDPT